MNITIGRDSNTNQLRLSSGKVTANYGLNNTVSPYVSREHCRITIDDDSGQMTISNLNPDNLTYVNKVAVETKIIQGDESVELGYERYPLTWTHIYEFMEKVMAQMPKKADIRPLKAVWEEYHRKEMKLRSDEKLFNAIRGGIPILTIGSGIAAFYGGSRLVLPSIIALVLSVIIFIKALIDAKRIDKKRDNLNHQFMHDYTCPLCHKFFGNYPYDIVSANNNKCSGCGAKLIK